MLVALLLCVVPDLALSSVPGVFVFDLQQSVESVQGGRARVPAPLSSLPGPSRPVVSLVAAPRPALVGDRPVPPRVPRADVTVHQRRHSEGDSRVPDDAH